MGLFSIGRSLLMKQVFLACLTAALGGFVYFRIEHLSDVARAIAAGDASTAATAGETLVAALEAAAVQLALACGAVALFIVALLAPATYALLGRPIRDLADAMDRFSAGDTSIAIAGEGRGDEIGVMARALERLRADAIVRRDHAEGAASRADTAQDVRARTIAQRFETFSTDLATTVGRLTSMTKRLAEAADNMIVAARHASDGSDQATGASSNAAADVSSVAAASEQLLDSIEEISRQVVQSTNVVKTAVERAVETNAGMGRLSDAAQKVGDVVSLISRIAAQTNLLALNATIEAARAGEAGRGFAVVAQEVKTLATQTAKATQDITGQITEMQQATDLSVDAIDKIQKKISEVEHISTIIAAAVHEQGAATQEIARNVRSAAAGTASMSGHMEAVVRGVNETSESAASVSILARELDGITGTMTELVENFTRSLRAA